MTKLIDADDIFYIGFPNSSEKLASNSLQLASNLLQLASNLHLKGE